MADLDSQDTKNKAFYQAILDSALIGFVVINKDAAIVYFNREAEQLFGYTSAEICGQKLETLVPQNIKGNHPELRKAFMNAPSSRLMGAGLNLKAVKKNGDEFPVEIALNAVSVGGEEYYIAAVTDIFERLAIERQEERDKAHASKIRQLYEELSSVSTPLLDVWENVVMLPLVGTLDSRRAQDTMEQALNAMEQKKAHILILDITGVLTVDTMVADALLQMTSAIRLMGGEAIITGISPQMAHTFVKLGIDTSNLKTLSTLAQGLELAIKLSHRGATS